MLKLIINLYTVSLTKSNYFFKVYKASYNIYIPKTPKENCVRLNLEDRAFNDTRFLKLSKLLKIDSFSSYGIMCFVWYHSQNRLMTQCTDEQINEFTLYKFDKNELVNALVQSGFLHKMDNVNYMIVGNEKHVLKLNELQNNGKFGHLGSSFGKLGGRPKGVMKNPHQGVMENPPIQFNSMQYNSIQYKERENTYTLKSKNGFERQILALYEKYPRKAGKTRGIKKLTSEIKSDKDLEHFSLAIDNYKKSVDGSDEKYIKHFSTFVSEWRDWIETKKETKYVTHIPEGPVY